MLPGTPASVLLTTHPSALLRVRGRPEWGDALAAFVTDLRTAADAAGFTA
ncbi:hypothetical protein L1785_00960 [Antribacter sp. KLBMP9083]|uniref:Uncharacterized protein n=1 Tax=Antribacter soli TaxID=2910976 RepID=A0AA41QCF9_9MICO|nr:hypothetical protein [Antribacter soli]MCF4119547.1 hypothetical protein [Antribacter soli]